MPQSESALKYFKRYSKFYLQGDDTCWRVEATDWISVPGILEIIAVEYYANETEDDIEAGIVGGLIEPVVDPNGEEETLGIQGETFIKPKRTYTYTFSGRVAEAWKVDEKYPVELEYDKNNSTTVNVTWTRSYSGQFELRYGSFTKTIVVESLF